MVRRPEKPVEGLGPALVTALVTREDLPQEQARRIVVWLLGEVRQDLLRGAAGFDVRVEDVMAATDLGTAARTLAGRLELAAERVAERRHMGPGQAGGGGFSGFPQQR